MAKTLKPLSVQLYSLRDEAKKDFLNVLQKVASFGYVGVEPAGFWNMTPKEFIKVIDDLGLKMFSSHSPWVRPDTIDEAMATAHELGLNKLVCGFGPDDFKDLDAVKRSAESGRQMLEKVTRNGFTLFQHNHYWEFDRIDGKLKYDIYRELCPGMKYQIDCFWSTNKGTEDPVEMLKKFSDDTILIHMKDGKTVQPGSVEGMKNGLLDCKIDLLPLGEGELPIKRLIAEMPEQVETVIVELDYCNSTDMFSAIERSCRYMLENHLALGRN